MSRNAEWPASELATKLRNAARRGTKVSLGPAQVALLMLEPVYRSISAIEAEEIRRKCHAATANDNDNSSEIFGCGSAPIAAPGTSAGSNVIPLDAASRGAALLLREEAALMRRRKKR